TSPHGAGVAIAPPRTARCSAVPTTGPRGIGNRPCHRKSAGSIFASRGYHRVDRKKNPPALQRRGVADRPDLVQVEQVELSVLRMESRILASSTAPPVRLEFEAGGIVFRRSIRLT